jgi:hypothetical protein
MKLKSRQDIETAATNFIGILQQAAQAATPKRHPLSPADNLPSEIKRLVAIKRRARSNCKQPTLQKIDFYLMTQATNLRPPSTNCGMQPLLPTSPLLKATTSPSEHRSNQGKIHEHHSPQFVKIQHPQDLAKSDSEKVELFANHLAEVFTHHDNTPDPEVERELATHNQHSEDLQAFTLCELKPVIKHRNPIKGPGLNLITAYMIQEMPPEGLQTLLHTYIQRFYQIGILASAPKTRKDHHDTKAGEKSH